jgi:predicted phosphohydrolase
MNFQYCSDLHLEFEQNSVYLRKYPIEPIADILILAGDITYLRSDFYNNPFFDYISDNWEKVYWIPGNHEYYCGIDIIKYNLSEPYAIRNNVFLVDNYSYIEGDVLLIFSTLWSKIDSKHKNYIEQNVSDFDCIYYNNKKLNSESFNFLHQESLAFIKKSLQQEKNLKKLVVTHHLPSQQCNHLDYLGSKLNSAFVANLDEFIEKYGPNAWIYGHSHRNMPEITIGKTKLYTNQFGYLQYSEHKCFDRFKAIDI